MNRLTAYVAGKVQKTGYRARVLDFARVLGLKGTVENLDDGRVRIIVEGDDDKLKWFEDAINIKNTLIQVSSIEKEYSAARGEFTKFYKLVEPGETDSRLDTAAEYLKILITSVDNMSDNLGGKMDVMIQKQDAAAEQLKVLITSVDNMNDNLGGKMDVMLKKQDQMLDKQDQMLDKQDQMLDKQDQMLDKQDQMLDLQHDLIGEVKESRRDLKGYLDQRFEKLEGEVVEMKIALKAKRII